jgi:hypothetical protein
MNAQKVAEVTAKLVGNEELTEDVKKITCKILGHSPVLLNTETHKIANEPHKKLQIRICDITWRETDEIPF